MSKYFLKSEKCPKYQILDTMYFLQRVLGPESILFLKSLFPLTYFYQRKKFVISF
jgi:hypothetical protein